MFTHNVCVFKNGVCGNKCWCSHLTFTLCKVHSNFTRSWKADVYCESTLKRELTAWKSDRIKEVLLYFRLSCKIIRIKWIFFPFQQIDVLVIYKTDVLRTFTIIRVTKKTQYHVGAHGCNSSDISLFSSWNGPMLRWYSAFYYILKKRYHANTFSLIK